MSYWDYIHLDTLLTLQTPKTDFPDENIFIIYHQITELYFKLIINELEQISNNGKKLNQTEKIWAGIQKSHLVFLSLESSE